MTDQANASAAATPKKMSEEAKAKQAEAMRKRWQDPEYRKRVQEGRAATKAKREAEKPAEAKA